MPILEDVKNAGWPGLLLLLLGILGILLAGLSLTFAAARMRAAFHTGLAALALAAVILFGGALGTMYGRHKTDEVLAMGIVSDVHSERLLRVGYEEARSASKLGLWFAAAPLLMGAIAAFSGARRPKDPSAQGVYGGPKLTPEAESSAWLPPLALLALAMFGTLGTALFLLTPLPGRPWAYDDPRWQILEATKRVLEPRSAQTESPPGSSPCEELSRALSVPEARHDEIEDLQKAISTCVDLGIAEAESASTLRQKKDTLEKLQDSALVTADDEKKKVRDAIEKLPKEEKHEDGAEANGSGASNTPEKPSVKADITSAQGQSVTGNLPQEVIQRIIRRHLGNIKSCYERALQRSPELEGTIRVRFVIGPKGSVTSAKSEGSTMQDPTVVNCVLNVISGLTFPEPEGGTVSVVYPFIFKAAD